MTGSTSPVPWRLIPADGKIPADNKSYYLTTDVKCVSHNPRVPTVQEHNSTSDVYGSMATLEEGDQRQMWEFIPII